MCKDINGCLDLEWFELSDSSDRSGLYPAIAASAPTQSGIRFDRDGNKINVDNGSYVTYSYLNFGEAGATSSIIISYSKGNNVGRDEMRLDALMVMSVASLTSRTGNREVSEDTMVGIDHVDGVHDLAFVGRDKNEIFDMKLSKTIYFLVNSDYKVDDDENLKKDAQCAYDVVLDAFTKQLYER